jgi:hypothetical protein
MKPVVEAYQAMRGASFLVAVIFAAEIGDVRRFERIDPGSGSGSSGTPLVLSLPFKRRDAGGAASRK